MRRAIVLMKTMLVRTLSANRNGPRGARSMYRVRIRMRSSVAGSRRGPERASIGKRETLPAASVSYKATALPWYTGRPASFGAILRAGSHCYGTARHSGLASCA